MKIIYKFFFINHYSRAGLLQHQHAGHNKNCVPSPWLTPQPRTTGRLARVKIFGFESNIAHLKAGWMGIPASISFSRNSEKNMIRQNFSAVVTWCVTWIVCCNKWRSRDQRSELQVTWHALCLLIGSLAGHVTHHVICCWGALMIRYSTNQGTGSGSRDP